jgi:carboxyl-terminal processing protease
MISLPLSQRRAVVLSALFMILIVLIAGGSGIYVFSDIGLKDSLNLFRVAATINHLYQKEVDWDKLTEAAMDGMFANLDRYSGYVPPRMWNQMHQELGGTYSGIGISVIEHDDGLLVMSVRENGPAAAAGILMGDIIIRVDSVSLHGLTAEESTDILRGPEGTEAGLTVLRPVDHDTLSVHVSRREIAFEHIPFAGFTPDSVLYIRLLDFDAGASSDVKAAVDSLLDKPGMKAQGIILDLRGNPGGLFAEAFHTANLFLEKGLFIVGTDGRSRWEDESFYSRGPDITDGLPMAILVDGGSASSSEIVAGSLSQLGRAVLVGDTTFGKGLVQGFSRLDDGSGVRLTVSRYYLADSLYLNQFDSTLNEIGRGLVPKVLVRFTEQESFPRALERSLLLNRFATSNQDEIIGVSDQFGLDDSWISRFERFAADEGFKFSSSTTSQAKGLSELAVKEDVDRTLRSQIESFLERSRQLDQSEFTRHAPYIKMRLKQVALERKFGSYVAYQRAVVPSRADIQIAARLLKSPTHE